jgi:pyridoxamine 5'-phosphate oxidase family protein
MPFMFTDAEIAYITSQPLGRLATVGPDGRPHVMPVGVFYDPEAEAVVDNLAAVDPWTPRGIEIRGDAETHTTGGEEAGRRVSASFPFSPAWIRIRPRRILAWGIDTGSFELTARDVA